MSYAVSDEVLLELGRFTWAAMHLEDAVIRISMELTGDQTTGRLVSQYVTDARKAIATLPDGEARQFIEAWLTDAVTALDEERNQILHATPEILLDPDTMEYSRALGVMPRKGKKRERDYRRRPMEVEHLRAAINRVALLDARWSDVDYAIMRARGYI
jgi:hypothetical protein